jgi:ABC-type enterochelin transport system substrate-binding protein
MASTAETVKLAVFGPTAVLAVLHFSMNVTPADENVNLVVMSISMVGFIFAP